MQVSVSFLVFKLYIGKFSIMSFQTDKNLATTFLNIIIIFFLPIKVQNYLNPTFEYYAEGFIRAFKA